jgi:hypothetical protein
MPDLQLTLDGALADLSRTDALQRVDDHADPDWRSVAYDCVVAVAKRCASFTTDEVLENWQNIRRSARMRAGRSGQS